MIGILMLALLAVALVATGLPAWTVLLGVASTFAVGGSLLGVFPLALLNAVASRLVGLLESDLLQALPLYVLMGALLNRLPLAQIVFRSGAWALRGTDAGPSLAGMGLGVLLAPMNGSVGASVATLGRIVLPRLRASGMAESSAMAQVCVTSTLGVVVPPSLVLILLADAMMRAHTEAVNATGVATRIVNTQDVFVGALVPASILFALFVAIAWFTSRGHAITEAPIPAREAWTGLAVSALVLALLAAVTLGYLYAVEAAATGGVALLAYAAIARGVGFDVMKAVLRDTVAITGALFALLVGATTFTLVLRAFGTDGAVGALLAHLAGGGVALAVVLIALACCALVLDAFEIIFVVVPVLMPPLLTRVPDATWVSVLALLILQASFLAPPFGYAFLMMRSVTKSEMRAVAFARAIAPYLLAQVVVLVAVLAWPGLIVRR